jgi:hypothetical protein
MNRHFRIIFHFHRRQKSWSQSIKKSRKKSWKEVYLTESQSISIHRCRLARHSSKYVPMWIRRSRAKDLFVIEKDSFKFWIFVLSTSPSYIQAMRNLKGPNQARKVDGSSFHEVLIISILGPFSRAMPCIIGANDQFSIAWISEGREHLLW